jgi:hypothetical protein
VTEENREGVRILRPGIGEIPNRLDADPSLPESIDKRDLCLIHLIQVLLSPRLLLLSTPHEFGVLFQFGPVLGRGLPLLHHYNFLTYNLPGGLGGL